MQHKLRYVIGIFALGVLCAGFFVYKADAQLSGGSGTINQLSQWMLSGGYVKTASTTAGLQVQGLANCNTIDTDGDGKFTCGTDATGGTGSGSSLHATTSANTFVYPQYGLYHSAPYYSGTSTTATSTFLWASTTRLSITDLFGRITYSNLPAGTSQAGVIGAINTSAANMSFIPATTDGGVLRRSGAAIDFGTINLASDNAVSGALDIANGGTGATTFPWGWVYSPGGEGILSASSSPTVNYVTATSGTSTLPRLSVQSSINIFGTFATALSDLCVAITGGSGLCDGSDDGAGGSSTWTDGGSVLYPAGGEYAAAPYFAGTSTTMSDFVGGVSYNNWTLATTTTVCASGCEFTNIQTALNAGYKDIVLKAESYAGPVTIDADDVTIRGAGMYSSKITCDATSNPLCVSIATTTTRTRITLEDFGIDNTNITIAGTGLDTSDANNVYTKNMRITDFNIGHLVQDTDNATFYNTYTNMVYFDVNNCFVTGGTKSNQNQLVHPRCRIAAGSTGGYGYKFVDAEGWLLESPDSEPATVGEGIALYVDGTSIGITVVSPWFEGNATGAQILSGALNTTITGGRITANTLGVSNAAYSSLFYNTLVTSNTTNITDTTVTSAWFNPTSAYSSTYLGIGTSTPRNANTRLGLGISSSSALDPMFILNNAGAFAAAYSGIMFDNSAGGFANGIAKIGAEPGSGYADASLKFHVADASKVLQERMRIDVNGRVGIGTTSPMSLLAVNGTTSGQNFVATSTTATSTFPRVKITGALLGSDYVTDLTGTGLAISSGSLIVDVTANFTWTGTHDFSGGTVKMHKYKSFTWPAGTANATTTTATTTIPLGTSYVANTFNGGQCWSGSGTIQYQISDGTNKTTTRAATTTVSQFAHSTNNTFIAQEKQFIEIGPMTMSYLSCSFDITEN